MGSFWPRSYSERLTRGVLPPYSTPYSRDAAPFLLVRRNMRTEPLFLVASGLDQWLGRMGFAQVARCLTLTGAKDATNKNDLCLLLASSKLRSSHHSNPSACASSCVQVDRLTSPWNSYPNIQCSSKTRGGSSQQVNTAVAGNNCPC